MTPYADTREHLLDELRRLDLLLRHHLEEWWAEHGGDVDEFRGLYVSDEEVDRLLRPTGDDDRRTNGGGAVRHAELLDRIERRAREVRARTLRTDEATDLRLVELAERFDLGRRHLDTLLIGLAPELDRKYEKIYGYLQDDVTRTRPTAGLALGVLCGSATERLDARRLFSPSSPLLEHGLVRLSPDDAPLPSRAVTVDERIVDYLLGNDELDAGLSGIATRVELDAGIDDLEVDDQRRETIEALAAAPETTPALYYFHGPYGSRKRTAVAAICRATGTPLLRVDLGGVAGEELRETLDRVAREATLREAAVHLANVGALPDGDRSGWEELLSDLDGFGGDVFVTGEEPWTPRGGFEAREVAIVEFPRPGYALRRELWRRRAGALPEGLDTDDLAATFRLTPGQVDDAIAAAAALGDGDGLTPEAVYRGCRAQSGGTLDSLSRKIEPHYTWDDIVLPADRMAHLREVAAHVKHRGTVYADWGFEDKFSLGNGLVVLFSGPSGTGKTMAADIIAGDAGLDLYKIDLAGVVSKYIGETEKNLGKIFDEAENSDAVLFFDEADALFGKRSEVKDSHDRYANVEVNYLLQRVEEHDGTVILTTNFEKNIDDAFRRRIHLSVDFPLPDRASREAIWRAIFPDETPVGDLDIGFLSGFEIAGGNIKNIALTAAFLAADDDDDARVEMEHVVRSTKREFGKMGKLVDPEEFGEYRDLVTR